MIDFSTSLAGMNAAAATVNKAAARLANPTTPEPDGPAADVVALKTGSIDFALNAKALKVQDEMTKSLFDIMG